MTRLERLPDWQPRLRAYLMGVGEQALVAGQHDCALFGAGGVEAETGVDLAADWRGRYATFAGGKRILRRAGFADHIALIGEHLPEVAVQFARPGDIAIVPTENGDAVGIVQGSSVYVLTPTGRIGLVSIMRAARVFKVGGFA